MKGTEELAHWATKMGWEHDELGYESDYRMRFWRGEGERMELIWRGERFASSESWFESPEVRGRQQILDPAAAATALRTSEPTYDFAAMDDNTVAEYLAGKQIEWVNTFTGLREKATVPKDARSTHVYSTRMGRRVLTFADSAFRSVGLDAITDLR